MSDISKRDRILESAFEIFIEKGYHTAKIEEIAKNAGIGKGTVYEYFSGKQEIFEESFINNVNKSFANMRVILDSELAFKEKLAKFLEYKYNIITIHSSLADIFIAHGDLISDRIKGAFHSFMVQHSKDIIAMIEQGVEEKVIRKNVNREILCSCLMGVSNHYLGMMIMTRKDEKPDYGFIIESILEGFGENKEDCNEN
jgi:AcrR family transcriptional regulator